MKEKIQLQLLGALLGALGLLLIVMTVKVTI
jgi:hypothetical protein